MATRNIIDLSQPITPASPAPCDPPVEFRTVASHGPDSPYQMMWFGMTDHTGTHRCASAFRPRWEAHR